MADQLKRQCSNCNAVNDPDSQKCWNCNYSLQHTRN